eukprot:CAMPEP_0115042740 /NCGR_PEP_ID=MMETSP0216-20121206/46439_1 /TAXON_ID=223996 /ORGANISM="Protocruzia adherens, Strain Boccale" /LENGTH=227 /DNA_ID=CAMNT_0002424899 /DNA_START=171 /DNA_END=850 /DNA_ORIENTATION=+
MKKKDHHLRPGPIGKGQAKQLHRRDSFSDHWECASGFPDQDEGVDAIEEVGTRFNGTQIHKSPDSDALSPRRQFDLEIQNGGSGNGPNGGKENIMNRSQLLVEKLSLSQAISKPKKKASNRSPQKGSAGSVSSSTPFNFQSKSTKVLGGQKSSVTLKEVFSPVQNPVQQLRAVYLHVCLMGPIVGTLDLRETLQHLEIEVLKLIGVPLEQLLLTETIPPDGLTIRGR